LGTIFGTGCVATGQTSPAAISGRSVSSSASHSSWGNSLVRAAASAPAALLLGDTAQHIVLPGFLQRARDPADP
jgi:hypothetical protein